MPHLVQVWTEEQWRTALLVKKGRVWNQYIILDKARGVRLIKIKGSEGYKLNSNVQQQDPIKTYLYMGERLGITNAAKAALTGV